MTLAVGTGSDADFNLWNLCDPVILERGEHMRSCDIPFAPKQLFVGWGPVALTREALESEWSNATWDLWIDDQSVDLPRFGWSDRRLIDFSAAGGKDVTLREWSVVLEGVTPGDHNVRYRIGPASGEAVDATWTFNVAK